MTALPWRDVEPCCACCGRKLARGLSRPWEIQCPRCGAVMRDARVKSEPTKKGYYSGQRVER